MARPRKTSSLSLWMNGEPVGRWTVTAQGQHELHYHPDWISSPRGRPISLSMPFRPSEPYKQNVVRNFFENLLPDNDTLRRRIAERFRTTTQAFDLLAQVGRDCAGALQILPEGEAPKDVHRVNATPLSEEEIERHLSRVILNTRSRMDEEDEEPGECAEGFHALILR